MDPQTRLRLKNFIWLAIFAACAFGGLYGAFRVVRAFMTAVLEIP